MQHSPSPRHPWASYLAGGLLCVYLGLLLVLTTAPNPRIPVESINVIPFRSILAGIERGGWLFWVNVLGNIGAFCPLGVLLPVWQPRINTLSKLTAISFALSSAIEIMHLALARRVSDIDDVILNVLGALIGWCCYRAIWSLQRSPRDRSNG